MGTNKSTLFEEAYEESADTVHLLNYDLLVSEIEEDKPTKLLKVGTYVIIRKGETIWYPGLVIDVDNDANEIEVKFMYPSGNKCNKFSFGNADPVWCPVENVVLEREAPACDQRELYPFHDNAINTIEKLMNDMKQQ